MAFLPRDRRDDLLADLDEEFQLLAATAGSAFARKWYAAQILRSLIPVFGRWLGVRTTGLLMAAGAPSIGTAFFALALFWLTGVAWMMPLTDSHQGPAASLTKGWRPGAVTLENGSARPVYSLEEEEASARSFETPALIRFTVAALAPPATAAIGVCLVLAIFDARRRNREAGLYDFRAKLNR